MQKLEIFFSKKSAAAETTQTKFARPSLKIQSGFSCIFTIKKTD